MGTHFLGLRPATTTSRSRRWLWLTIGLATIVAAAGCGPGTDAESPVEEEIPIMASREHVREGEDPGPYNSDPPTSGKHYSSSLEPGFYDQGVLAEGPAYPEGYLVHSLEHGYVIFWYNCAALETMSCGNLKEQIREVMVEYEGDKLIAFPRASIDQPVVMTSWGHRMAFPTFEAEAASGFIERNRYNAPEPLAP